ncbi:hypothetical protein E8L99_21680 [Phreatobacter aquaticus]|uniref:Uncharacterized protein n=1 Tax=Phreatobacter aquaticus TaxID=2570229 RepID=A0A4D7QRH5_9HYPH|nr:hypothetical protein [Phreatobacter aquaticus]QCK88186.1 hypothetical protein E8L99_21680 [Phreatobacter aquaticus]
MPPTPDNPKGYFESRKLQRFHDLVLADLGSAWDDWRAIEAPRRQGPGVGDLFARAVELLNSEFLHSHGFVLKDPRVCRFPGLWLDVFKACSVLPLVVLAYRHPLEVAGSLARRDGMTLEKALLIWLRHVLDAERFSRGKRRSALDMNEVMADWRTAMGRVGVQLGIDWSPAIATDADAVDAFIDENLRTIRASSGADTVPAPLLALALETYAAMGELCAAPDDGAVMAALDAVAARFDSFTAEVGRGSRTTVAEEVAIDAEAARVAALAGPRPAGMIADPTNRRLTLVSRLNADRLAWLTEVVEEMARTLAVQQGQLAQLAGSIGDHEAPDRKPLAFLEPMSQHAASMEATLSGLSISVAETSSSLDRVTAVLEELRLGQDVTLREASVQREMLIDAWTETGDRLSGLVAAVGPSQARLLADQGLAIRQAVEQALAAVLAQSAGQEGRIAELVARAKGLFDNAERRIDAGDRAIAHLATPWSEISGRLAASARALAASDAIVARLTGETDVLRRDRDAIADQLKAADIGLANAIAEAERHRSERETCEAALLDVLERHAVLGRRCEELERRAIEAERQPRWIGLMSRFRGGVKE